LKLHGFLLLPLILAASAALAEPAPTPSDADTAAPIAFSIGGEARVRYEGYEAPGWGDGPDDGYWWLRLMPWAKVEAGAASVFVQPIAGYAIGVAGGDGPTDATGIDVLQAHADYTIALAPEADLHLRAGRSLIALGSERLVGKRYGPNIPQPFDGARLGLKRGDVQLDILAAEAVDIGPRDFDDRSDGRRRFASVYLSGPIVRSLNADLYWIGYRQRGARFSDAVGTERRDTFGLRLFGARGRLGWNWETMIQRGSFAGKPIAAWSQATETTLTISEHAPLRQLRIRANYVSGDRAGTGDRLEGFNAMFPKGRYFGELTPVGPRNIINVNPAIVLQPSPALSVEISAGAFWRASRGDGIYDLAGREIRPAGTTRKRHIGDQIEASATLDLKGGWSLAASLGVFTAGGFVETTGATGTTLMLGAEANFTF